MPSEWKVMKNYAGGECFWQVYRTRNVNEIDHSGNREIMGWFDTERAAQEFCDSLNKEEACANRS